MNPMELGSSPIDFKLKGVDGKTYGIDDFNDSKLLAIMFSCNHCPYVIASEREFIELQSEFGDEGFQLVAINSNSANPNYPGDSYENMIRRSQERGFNFPYLVDEDQSIAKAYQAGRTPEIFLYNKDRKLVYHGRINDNPKNHDEITRHDLRIAIEELLSNQQVSVPKTTPIGCSIKYTNY